MGEEKLCEAAEFGTTQSQANEFLKAQERRNKEWIFLRI